jgi:hypothetical protein
MKKIILILFIATSIFSNVFSQGTIAQKMQTPDTTGAVREKGVPDGSAIVSKTIGAGGGSVTYEDGRISVKIPQGALEEDATISIEPITSTLPYTAGPGAYRLLPEGLHFKKPVTITFSYNDSIVRGSSPEVLHIAYQHSSGVWKAIRALQLDKLNKTVSVQSTHFSDWAVLEQYQLLIDGYTSPDMIIMPSQKIVLTVAYTPIKQANNSQKDDDIIEPLVPNKPIPEVMDPDNEVEPLIPGTNPGTIKNWKVFGPGVLTETTSSMKCFYQGPSHTPPGNKPVYFSVDIVNVKGEESDRVKIVLFAQVRVEENYLEFEMKGEKIKFHLAQAYANSTGIGINGAGPENGVSIINLVIGGTKGGSYPFGELKNGASEIGLMWKGKGYATEYLIKCETSHPEKAFAKGTITIDAESSGNYLGIVKGSFRGTVYTPTCDGSQDPTEIKGKFIVQVHVSGAQSIYTEKYENHQKVMDNLLKIVKDLKMDKNIPKNIPKMPPMPKKKG